MLRHHSGNSFGNLWAAVLVIGALTAPLDAAAACRGAWAEGVNYAAGDTVTYNGSVYTARVAHGCNGCGWNPVAAPSLWQLGGTCSTTPTPTPTTTVRPTPTPTVRPTPTPTVRPTVTPTTRPTPTPTVRPTVTPTTRPTPTPTARPTATPTPATCYSAWNASSVYTGGMRVTRNNVNYEAKWWTQGQDPATNSCSDCVWRNLGFCDPVPTPTPTPTTTVRPTPTPTTTVRPTPTPTPTATPTTGTPVSRNGQLRVCGLRLCNEAGLEVQLRGMSTHGIQWYGWGACLTEASLDALAFDWKADILRISLYVQEGGYETNPAAFTAQVDRLINEASERGMYALVDWHQLDPGDPMFNVERAKTFFTHIAQTHGTKKNIIYDIANEPNGVAWTRIRDYAHEVIPVIRAIDPDALILVGTHGWASLGVSDGRNSDDIVAAPINHSNIMYTFHFYAASHLVAHRNELARASDRIPIFVTEWGSQTFTGDGANDFVSAQAYIDLMTQKKISWTNWNYSDDFRSGAVWNQGACSSGNWSASNLKPAGQWVRDRIRNR